MKFSAASSPGSRRSSASRWKKRGLLRFPAMTKACICRLSPRRPRRGADAGADRRNGSASATLRRVVTGALEIARARQGDRRQPRSARPFCVVDDAEDAKLLERHRSRRNRHHVDRAVSRMRALPDDAFRLPDVEGVGGEVRSRRRRQMRPLLDDPAGGGHRTRACRSLQPLHRCGGCSGGRHEPRIAEPRGSGVWSPPRSRWSLDQGSQDCSALRLRLRPHGARGRRSRSCRFLIW